MRAHGGSDGGSGWFGGGIFTAPLPLPCCFGATSSLFPFLLLLPTVLLSTTKTVAAGGDGLGSGLGGGRWLGSPVTATVLSSLQRLLLFCFLAFSPLSPVFPSVSCSLFSLASSSSFCHLAFSGSSKRWFCYCWQY